MANWLAMNNDISRIPEITHARLVAANVHYRSFGKLIKGFSHFKNFAMPVVKGFSPTKVVKTSASSSPANGSSGYSFGFVKYTSCLGSVKKPSPLLEIEKPP